MPTTESAIAFEDAAAWIKDGSIEALARLQRSREGLTKYLAFKQQVGCGRLKYLAVKQPMDGKLNIGGMPHASYVT
eukprot:365917-Chlamydomonas_euryale.AAC.17